MDSSVASNGRNRLADGKTTRQDKRRKFEAKQGRKRSFQQREQERLEWFEQTKDYYRITNQDLEATEETEVTCWLKPYRNLRESGVAKEGSGRRDNGQTLYIAEGTENGQTLFIAEGTETVRLLIQKCRDSNPVHIEVVSIFVKPSVLFDEPVKLLDDIENANQEKVTDSLQGSSSPPFCVLCADESVMSRIVGFDIARGALACGIVPSHLDESWLFDYLKTKESTKPLRLLALDGICDTANLGSMIRTASAFGITAILLSADCCDAWYRRSIRVSMGHVFRVPCIRTPNLASLLKRMAVDHHELVSYAAVVDSSADLSLGTIRHGSVGSSWCCVMGNESKGISRDVRAACNFSLRIQMEAGVDSLSVPIATGILLNGLREREESSEAA